MDIRNKQEDDDLSGDVEADCAPIEGIRPFTDISKDNIKDCRFSSVDSGYDSVKSLLNRDLDSISDDLDKLKLGRIEEGCVAEPEQETNKDLYEPLKCTEERDSKSVDEEENASHQLRENREILLEIFKPDKDGDSQLHMAIIQMLSQITMYFISLIPSHHWLNIPNNLLQVPLHLATITRQPEIVRKLMAAGADVTPRDYKGDTPLHIACREGYDDIVQLLLTPIQYNETSSVRYPLQHQSIPQDLQLMNYNGQSCLHLAAERCHLAILELLLQNKADINIKDGKSGKTVLHYAAEKKDNVLINYLVSKSGIEIDATTYGGLTALQLAEGRRYSDVVNYLKGRGAIFGPLPSDDDSDDDMVE